MMESNPANDAAFADELRHAVHQAEQLLDAIGDDSDEALSALRERVYFSIDTAKMRLADMEEQAQLATQRFATRMESFAREHPWTVVAVGAGVGILAGVLLARLLVGQDETPDQDGDTPTQATAQ